MTTITTTIMSAEAARRAHNRAVKDTGKGTRIEQENSDIRNLKGADLKSSKSTKAEVKATAKLTASILKGVKIAKRSKVSAENQVFAQVKKSQGVAMAFKARKAFLAQA